MNLIYAITPTVGYFTISGDHNKILIPSLLLSNDLNYRSSPFSVNAH